MLDDDDKPEFTPAAFDSLRQVPMYASFIKERFERCLDLYLCPRSKKKRINVDPQSLVPKLPKPQDLQPFPTTLLLCYTGHTSKVHSMHVIIIASDPMTMLGADKMYTTSLCPFLPLPFYDILVTEQGCA